MDERSLRARNHVDHEEPPAAPHAVPVIGEKVTSPELASLAAKYLSLERGDLLHALALAPEARINTGYVDVLLADVRRLAASVLSQAERADV